MDYKQPERGRPIDIKLLFLECTRLNPTLNAKSIIEITGSPERTAFKWLSEKEDSKPTIHDMILILTAMKYAGMKIPRDLARLSGRGFAKAKLWGESNAISERYEMVGELLNRKSLEYVFRGELLNVFKIALRSNNHYSVVRNLLNEVTEGTDVTEMITDRPRRKFRKQP